eukprot:2987021-Rhodomonas_salina.1
MVCMNYWRRRGRVCTEQYGRMESVHGPVQEGWVGVHGCAKEEAGVRGVVQEEGVGVHGPLMEEGAAGVRGVVHHEGAGVHGPVMEEGAGVQAVAREAYHREDPLARWRL